MAVGRNYAWYLVIVFLFLGDGGAKDFREVLKLSLWEGSRNKGGRPFHGEVDS